MTAPHLSEYENWPGPGASTREPWYYKREPRPGISVIGARLSELVRR
jgi:hypothetical protein